MKITFISTQPAFWGGSEVLWVRCAMKALDQGYQVQVVVYEQPAGFHSDVEELRKKVESFQTLRNFNTQNSKLARAGSFIKNRVLPERLDYIERFMPDILIVSQANNYDAAFHPGLYSFLSTFNRRFFLISQFNDEHRCLSFGDILKARNIFGKASGIFFVSERNKKVTERQIAMSIDNAIIIDNPLNLQDISYVTYPEKMDVVNFASVARFDVNYKGQDILMQIFGGEQWRDRPWYLNLYGEGDDKEYLIELVKFYGLQDRVKFKGHVASVRQIWETNHILLMPSIAEGKPLALQEAMICGRVGVVSDVAGNSELVDDSINGYLASSYFPEPFSTCMERAWNERHLWQEKGKAAREKMLNSLDLSPETTILNYSFS